MCRTIWTWRKLFGENLHDDGIHELQESHRNLNAFNSQLFHLKHQV